MGGTSCDVCLVLDGEPLYSSDFEVEFGFPVSVPSVSTRTIGAGGGSIGWVDPGGFLQVGPQSAGASPGPACYGEGGTEATITDANLVLGRLDPSFFLGGRLQLDLELATAALARLGEQLGRSGLETASAMVRVCNENMANAIRILTVEQGTDPREHALIAFGGAGPTHACEIADALDIRRVLVPPAPGLCSAFGALAAGPRIDAVRSVYLTDVRTTAAEVGSIFAELEEQARADFAAQGLGEEPTVRRLAAMRYQGQNYEQEVPFPAGEIDDEALQDAYDRVRAAVRGLLRLPPRRHPDRARPAGRDRDRRGAGVRPPARVPRAGRGRARRRATSSSPTQGFVSAADRPPRGARARRRARGTCDRRVHGLDRRRPAGLDAARRASDGILEVTR